MITLKDIGNQDSIWECDHQRGNVPHDGCYRFTEIPSKPKPESGWNGDREVGKS